MQDNKNEKISKGNGIPDIDFKKKEEELSSTLQFKVADAISKAKQNKDDLLDSQRESAEQDHFVIDVSTKSVDKVDSVNLLNGSKKSSSEQSKSPQSRHAAERPSSQSVNKQPPPQRGEAVRKASAQSSSHKGSSTPPKKKKWTKRKKALVITGIVFVFLFALILIVYGYFHKWNSLLKTDTGKIDSTFSLEKDTSSQNTVDKEAEEDRIKAELRKMASSIMSEDGVQNILLIGEDIRDTALEERGNTDVMMMISLDENRGKITMTSFLRDTYTPIPGWNASKLNAAYGYGGVELLAATLQQDYAINIDRYVIVNFYSFIEIVDAVGGLDFDVSFTEAVAMRDPLNEQNNYLGNKAGTGYIDFKQYGKDESLLYTDYDSDALRTYIEYGSAEDNSIKLHLDGNQSLAYARSRYGCGDDYGRASRQREAIAEMISKAKGLSFSELDDLAEKVAKQVRTDINENEVAGLILNAFSYMDYDIQQLQIPASETFSNQIIDGLDCLSVDFMANAQIIQQTIYGKSNIDSQQKAAGPFADMDGNGVNDYFVDNNGDGIDDNMLDLDGDGIDDRAWNGGNTNTWS
ncbi:MAG: LCP family protein [Ruminococcus sp.]|nr:LCP family protein [Ruminococcus sp.]